MGHRADFEIKPLGGRIPACSGPIPLMIKDSISILRFRKCPRWLAGLLFWIFAVSCLAPTNLTAGPQDYRVTGIVRDQSGAAIAGAKVTLRAGTDTATQATDNQGRFEFVNIPAASGTVTFEAQGF